jgi:uncharacterized protein with HEPN domain
MNPEPFELGKRHLADLLEALQRCAYFIDHLENKIPWPLDGSVLHERCKDSELFDQLAAFNERFSKLQDTSSAAMRHGAVMVGEKTEMFLSVLAFFEKVGVIESMQNWQRIRTLRNMASHDYATDYSDIAQHFNALKSALPELMRSAVRISEFFDNTLGVKATGNDFEEEWRVLTLKYKV